MGVPALFRWLSNKYPKIVSAVIEEKPREVDGVEIPVDYTQPNPNGECDNLYLDMNGIVHPCSHPEDKAPPETEADMMLAIFEYTERVVRMARPRQILMIAIDGVAPRAKMNQQRSRRFRSVQEKAEKEKEKEEFLKLLASQNGGVLPPSALENLEKKAWDSNAITPGTPFMDILAGSLRYWTAYKLNTDPAWAQLKIIISDATVPGEGEHKIMEFVRSQRGAGHDPNTSHVIYGLDADLIMLGIATHEPHFRVLREDVFFQESKGRTCHTCGQTGHIAAECKGEAKKKEGEFDQKTRAEGQKPFIWLHVSVLREYLALEMHPPNQNFPFDLERALDDWVFMCFFVGNDFLPHLPSLEIREQGIDTLIAIWRDNAASGTGYVTEDGVVNMDRAQRILEGLAKQEDAIFKQRKEIEDRKEAKAREREAADAARKEQYGGNKKRKMKGDELPDGYNIPTMSLTELGKTGKWKADGMHAMPVNGLTHDMVMERGVNSADNIANMSAAQVLKQRMEAKKQGNDSPDTSDRKRKAGDIEPDEPGTPGRKSPIPDGKPVEQEPPSGDIRLWEAGYADRYYEQKFHVAPEDKEFRQKVARAYAEGLAWVLLYYFQGCASWTWYFPYHYAPFAADFQIADMEIKFEKGKPFRPYEQLMGVMPAASRHTIPEPFHPLMTEDDSVIKHFYPEDFPLDLNGKKWAWQGVVILPFIDEKLLLSAMATRYPLLTDEERERNEPGQEALLFSDRHPMYATVMAKMYGKQQKSHMTLDAKESQNLYGKIAKNDEFLPGGPLVFPTGPEGSMPTLEENQALSVFYEMPKGEKRHKSMLLPNVEMPDPVLEPDEIEQIRGRAMRTGRDFTRGGSGRGRGGFRGGRGGGFRGNGHGHGNGDRRQSGGDRRYGSGPPSQGSYGQQPPAYGGYAPPPGAYGYPPPPGAYGAPPPSYGGYGGPPPPSQAGYGSQRGGYLPPPPGYGGSYGSYQPPPPPAPAYGQGGFNGGGWGAPQYNQAPHGGSQYGSGGGGGGQGNRKRGHR